MSKALSLNAHAIQDVIDETHCLLPTRRHKRSGLKVDSTLWLGIDPRLSLQWKIPERFRRRGYRLMLFRRSGGLSPVAYPHDLSAYGDLVFETVHNGEREERLGEGTFGYTFLLQGMWFFGLLERHIVVRFTETVPSAKVAIGRLRDHAEFQDLLATEKLRPIEFAARQGEAVLRLQGLLAKLDPPPQRAEVEERSAKRDEIGELLDDFFEEHQQLDRIKSDPRFKALNPAKRKDFLKRVGMRLDPAERGARREK